MNRVGKYSIVQIVVLVTTRVLMGWYCLYEGVVKLLNPNWSSFAYLNDSQGWFAPIFRAIAENQSMMSIVDFLNVWGLIVIGLGLILGLFTRLSAILGIALIGLYFLSHPSLINVKYLMPVSENTMWVDKNLIFVFVLIIILVFPTGKQIGIDRLLFNRKKK